MTQAGALHGRCNFVADRDCSSRAMKHISPVNAQLAGRWAVVLGTVPQMQFFAERSRQLLLIRLDAAEAVRDGCASDEAGAVAAGHAESRPRLQRLRAALHGVAAGWPARLSSWYEHAEAGSAGEWGLWQWEVRAWRH